MYTCPPVKTLSSKRPDIIKFSPKLLADRALLYLVGLAGYWSERLHDFQVDENDARLEMAEDDGQRKLLIVVARKHYFETVRDYPLGNRRDLVGVLKNEPWRYPFEGRLLLKIERLTEQSHRVTSWVIKQEVMEKLPHYTCFIVPESACIQTQESSEAISLRRLDSDLQVSLSSQGLVSIEDQEALFTRQVNLSLDDNNGLEQELTRLSEAESISTILIGVVKSVKRFPLTFYSGPTLGSIRHDIVSRWAKVFISICLLYVAVTSLVIGAMGYLQDYNIRSITPVAERVIQLRSATLNKMRTLGSINEAVAGGSSAAVVWDLYLDLKSMGVMFSAVRTESSEVEFFCSFKDATEVLQYLENDPRVVTAGLSSAIRKERGFERFSVRIKLADVDSL